MRPAVAARSAARQRSPRAMALAYRIWCFAHPLGWDCTVAQIAEALDETTQQIGIALHNAGWTERTRVSPRRGRGTQNAAGPHHLMAADAHDLTDELLQEAA